MSQQLFEVGLGLSLDGLASVLPCNGAPGGDTGPLDNAPVGSLALDYANGKQYQKTTSGSGTDKWAIIETATAVNTEVGYVNSFIGKSAGNENPSYSSYAYTGGQNVSLETAIGGLDAGLLLARTVTTASNVTTAVTVDSVKVDDHFVAKWLVYAEDGAGAVLTQEVLATHNGYATTDATTVDYVASSKLKIGSITGLIVSVDVNGTGTSQVMRLRVQSTTAATIKAARYVL